MRWHLECNEIREHCERKGGTVENHIETPWKYRLTEGKFLNNNL